MLLVLMFGYYLWVDLVWHAIDQRSPRWDESHTLMISEHSYQALQRGDVLTALSLKDVSSTKPGMLPFLSALTYFAVGNSWVLATIIANACAMFTILFVLLRAGREFYDSAAVGAVAFLCFCNVKVVLAFSGYYQTDLPLTAAVCATIWLCWLIDRRSFSGRLLPVLLAISIVIGMGIKHLYVVFVAAPLALLSVRAVTQVGWPPRYRRLERVYLLEWLFIGVVLGTSYHLLNIHILQEHIARSKNAALTGGIGAPASPWTVFTQLVEVLPAWLWCALLAGSMTWALLARRWRILYPALCIVGGFIGVSMTASWPLSYYFFPIMPLGIFVAAGVLALPLPSHAGATLAIRRTRSVIIAGLLLVLALQYSKHRLGTRNLARVAMHTSEALSSFGKLDANPFVDTPYWKNATIDGNETTLPYPGSWAIEEFVGEIERRINTRPPRHPYVLLYCTGMYEWMTDEFGRYQARKLGIFNKMYLGQLFEVPKDKTPAQILADYDFVIIKTGKAMKADFYAAPWGPGFQAFIDGLTTDQYAGLKAAGFELLMKRDLPDGSEGSLWISTSRIPQSQPS